MILDDMCFLSESFQPDSRGHLRVLGNSLFTLGKVPGPRIESINVSSIYYIVRSAMGRM